MLYIIAIISLIVDRYTKLLAVNKLQNGSVPVIKDILHFTYVENSGAAFGFFKNGNMFFIIFTFLIAGIIVFMLAKYRPESKMIKTAAALVIGGAVGNLIDRMLYSYVIDFIDFRIINYPVFNIADCCIVCGAVLFAVRVIFFDNKAEKETK